MKTITVLGYNRPQYLCQVLAALGGCRGIEGWHVVVSIDDANHQLRTVHTAHDCAQMFPSRDVLEQTKRWGINWHNHAVYDHVFVDMGSEFNLALEDDTVPSPDALELCDWFFALPNRDDYCSLLLHSMSQEFSDPLDVVEAMRFNAWGHAMVSQTWNSVFRDRWMCKKIVPIGWDWSAEYVIQIDGRKSLNPRLSRIANIGREFGVNESPIHYDEWAVGRVASDGSYGLNYQIVEKLAPGYEKVRSDWVLEELGKLGEVK